MHVGARPTETNYHFFLTPQRTDCLNSTDADGGGSPGEPLRLLVVIKFNYQTSKHGGKRADGFENRLW